MKNPFPPNTAEHFFWKHAGYCYGPGETPEAGRARCARDLASAERRASELGLSFTWENDHETDASFRNTPNPYHLWVCCCYCDEPEPPRLLSSLCGIDLGRNGSPYTYGVGLMGEPTHRSRGRDPYCRVVEAELADEALSALDGGEA